jgi:hypothetical protein
MVGASIEDVLQNLANERHSPLGPRRLVWPFRNGVQWNPADDKCVAGEILRIDSDDWYLAGTLCEVKSVAI